MPAEKLKSIFRDNERPEEEVRDLINQIDLFELARLLHELPVDAKIRVFHGLDSDKKRQDLLYETDLDSRMEIQEHLDSDYLARLLDDMPEDEAADIIQEHPEETREELLSKISPEDANILKNLITYEEETAGGLMSPYFHRVTEQQTATDILVKIKRDPDQEIPPYFYVLDEANQLLGYFKLRDLLNVPVHSKALTFMRQPAPKVLLTDTCDKVANLMDHDHLSTIPVVDEQNVLHGIVTFDDVIRTIQDIASEDIFTMVGTARTDPFAKRAINKIAARAPWLLTTFAGGLLSAFILSFFENRIGSFATIILFVPFVLGLAGNVGIQGATVLVRGLATGDVKQDNLHTVVRSELIVGITNGFIFGILCGGCIALVAEPLLHVHPGLGFIVGSGIILAVAMASIIGSLTPILFIKIGIDPAISTGPIVMVLNDIVGISIYLVSATLFTFLI